MRLYRSYPNSQQAESAHLPFSPLYDNDKSDESDLLTKMAPHTMEKRKTAIESFRGKTARLDGGITPELLKDGGEAIASAVYSFCCEVYVEKTLPVQWVTNLVVTKHKNGYLSLITSYRGINLITICAKVYNKILLKIPSYKQS